MKKRARVYSVLLTIIMLLGFMTACAPSEGNKEGNSGDKVVYVTAGALGDNGFSDYTAAGIDRLAKDFSCDTKVIENNNDSAKFSQSMEAAFQWQPDIVFADAYGFEELYAQYADKNPKVKCINLDFVLDNSKNTITSVSYINEEGAFLAGVMAALVTTSDLQYANPEKKVGFIGGNDIPVIRDFEYGFKQGVAYVDKDIEVLSAFVGDFFDPVKGKQAAQQLYAQKCDIIFQAAGQTGAGILEASKELERYSIGVDSNQNSAYPGHVVASMVKDLNNTVYQVYEMIKNETFKQGDHIERGAGIGGVYLAMDEYTLDAVGQEIIDKVKDAENKIASGDIKVDRNKK